MNIQSIIKFIATIYCECLWNIIKFIATICCECLWNIIKFIATICCECLWKIIKFIATIYCECSSYNKVHSNNLLWMLPFGQFCFIFSHFHRCFPFSPVFYQFYPHKIKVQQNVWKNTLLKNPCSYPYQKCRKTSEANNFANKIAWKIKFNKYFG